MWTVNFAGREAVIPPLAAIIGLLILTLALWVVFKLAGLLVAVLRWVNGDDTAFSRYQQRNKERKGYAALSDSLIALASGEARDAAAKAQKAERLLGRPGPDRCGGCAGSRGCRRARQGDRGLQAVGQA